MTDEALDPGTHRAASRGQFRHDIATVAESSSTDGRFGRMFRNLPSLTPDEQWLDGLADQMTEAEGADSALPAGITYFGQFIDHDLTFDPVSSLQRQNDPDALNNFRTPSFDLDSIYGRGPADQPYLYRTEDRDLLLIGEAEAQSRPEGAPAPGPDDLTQEDDLPRNGQRVALVGDPRNDENIIVSQLQLAFLKLHNRLVGDLRTPEQAPDIAIARWPSGSPFEEAQRLARWHYQWLVLKFFLPAVCDPAVLAGYVVEDDLGDGRVCRGINARRFYSPKVTPYIPVEWSVAAYRFGHSLIRGSYHLNARLRGLRGGNPIDIFIENPTAETRLNHLAGGRQLPPFWSLDWRMFFESAHPEVQHARKIDTHLAGGLQTLPGATDGIRALAKLNLRRGRVMGLPSGQAVARRLCVEALTASELGFPEEAPLWFYVLKEAEVQQAGERLGVVGSTIVAETMLGMLAADPFCFLRTHPTWEPVLPRVSGGAPSTFSMIDLLAYAVPKDGRHLPQFEQPPPPPPGVPGW